MRFLPAILLPLLVSCDTWRLEADARSKCERGLAMIQRVAGMRRDALSDAERARTVTVLSSGAQLIRDGMASYAKANEKTGKSYAVTPYIEGLKAARMMLTELKD